MQRVATTTIPYTELDVAGPYNQSTGLGNFDSNRVTIDRIVIHTMAASWQGAAARFADPHSNVSAHYGVKLDGGLIHWLEEYYVAYHSGNYPMNQRSLSIENEDGGNYNVPRPDVLYTTSSKLVADICKFYNIPCDAQHIIPHRQVVNTACPDSLNVNRIIAQAQQLLVTPPPPTYPHEDLAKKAMQTALNETTTASQVGDPNFKKNMIQVKAQAQQIVNML